MRFRPARKTAAPIALALTSAILAACAGGGSSSGGTGNAPSPTAAAAPTPGTSLLTGTAATGAPLAVASVTVKDATGLVRSATTDASGAFSIDLTGLTAPLLIKVVGNVGGVPVKLFSVAPTLPAAGTNLVANATPLTHLMFAAMAGKKPESFFDNPDKAKIDRATLDGIKLQIQTAIRPLLDAAGVDATKFDMVSTQFNADKTGIDKLLEMIDVQVVTDSATGALQSTQLTSKLNPDDYVKLDGSGRPTDGHITPPPFVPDLAGLDALAPALTAKLATTAALATLGDLVDADFKNHGQNKAGFLADFTSDPDLVGAVFGKPVLLGCSEAKVCEVVMSLTRPSGIVQKFQMTVKKEADGTWKLFGDHRDFDMGLRAKAIKYVRVDGALAPAPQTGVEIGISTGLPTPGAVKSAIVSLVDATGETELFRLRDTKSACPSRGFLVVDNAADPANPSYCEPFAPLTDAQIAKLTAANPKFKVRLYSDYYTTVAFTFADLRIDAPLVKSTELATAPFPSASSATIDAFKTLTGVPGQLTASWTAAPDSEVNRVGLWLSQTGHARGVMREALGQSSLVLSIADPTLTAPTYRFLSLNALDGARRSFTTKYYGCGGGTCN
jgi:hypothetical protein